MEGTYKLKYTLYPTYDGDFSYDKEDYDKDSGYYVYRKSTIWKICTKEEYCKLENYGDEETEDFMSDYCDFDFVAYMKNRTYMYMLVNSIEDFIVLKGKSE